MLGTTKRNLILESGGGYPLLYVRMNSIEP